MIKIVAHKNWVRAKNSELVTIFHHEVDFSRIDTKSEVMTPKNTKNQANCERRHAKRFDFTYIRLLTPNRELATRGNELLKFGANPPIVTIFHPEDDFSEIDTKSEGPTPQNTQQQAK